jgi:hypothetical protein
MQLVLIEDKTHTGKNKLAKTRQGLPNWDGKTWRVTDEREYVGAKPGAGPWLLIEPVTTDVNADWFARWVHKTDDDNFTVTVITRSNK